MTVPPPPIGYRNSSLSVEFLREQSSMFVHLRWSLNDLRDFAKSSEELLERRYQETRGTDRFTLSPFIVRGSMLVMACGVLESFLTRFCDLLCKTEDLSLSPEDLRGSGIERAKIYIENVAGLPFPDRSWSKLVALFYVRHAIVHAHGKLTASRKIQSIRQHFPSVTIDPSGEVWPEAASVETALTLLDEFIDQVEHDIVGPSRKQAIAKKAVIKQGVMGA